MYPIIFQNKYKVNKKNEEKKDAESKNLFTHSNGLNGIAFSENIIKKKLEECYSCTKELTNIIEKKNIEIENLKKLNNLYKKELNILYNEQNKMCKLKLDYLLSVHNLKNIIKNNE